MGSTKDVFRSLQDPSQLIPLMRTEWFESLGGHYAADEWVGGQFLLHYQTEKMTAHFEDFTGTDYTVSLNSALSMKIG